MDENGTKWIVIASGGAIETALLPYHLTHLVSFYPVKVSVALSRNARDFVTLTALAAITKGQVYYVNRQLDPFSAKPLHISFSEADLLIVCPATARIIAQAAQGQITCPVTRLVAFMPKDRVIICPHLHPRMEPRLYHPHLANLRRIGCTVLGGDSFLVSWPEVEHEISSRLSISTATDPDQWLTLGDDSRHKGILG